MSQKLLPLNPRQMVGLADGNSFYCSCEESVQPWRKAYHRSLEQ